MFNEKDKWIVDMRIYIDLLIKANDDYIKLVGLDCIYDMYEMKNKFLDLARNISLLFPIEIKNRRIKKNDDESLWELKHNLPFLEDIYEKIFNKFKYDLYIIKLIRNKIEHSPHQIKANSYISGNTISSISFKSYKNYYDIEQFNQHYENLTKNLKLNDEIITETIKNDKGEIYRINCKTKENLKEIMEVLIENYENDSDIKKVITEIYRIDRLVIKNILIELNKVFIEITKKMGKIFEDLCNKDEKYKENAFIKKYFTVDFERINKIFESEDLYLISRTINENRKYLDF